jgi:class 3 adenylate cyclase/pimeloyl-ACP methyl ester carboxylesterase
MDPVPTRYIDCDGAALAYQIVGDGPADVVVFLELGQHLDLCWTDPDIHHVFERGASYARTVYMQRRGFGLSERISYTPTVEQQAEDVLAVMDAAGMRNATLVGVLGTCGPLALVAAKAPERVSALLFINPFAQGVKSADEIHGWTDAERIAFIEGYRLAFTNWGSGGLIHMWDPVQDTAYNRRLMALSERCSATPADAKYYFDWRMHVDVRDVLISVQVPTRVLRFPSSPVPEAAVRHVAELIPNATFHALPPTPLGASIGEAFVPVADHIEEVATGTTHSADADRYLGAVLFTDMVSSTELLASVGDAQYRQMRNSHQRQVRVAVEECGGHLMTVTGDGTMSVFEGPSKAVRCAETICREAEGAGIAVRCGVHTGELERDGMNVTGMTVHIGQRVSSAADPGQVLVSRTVHDLVVGSGMAFRSRGEHQLKGVPGSWELFAVTHTDEQQDGLPNESMQTSMDRVVMGTIRRAPRFTRAAVRFGNAIERQRIRASAS